eukprot:scaffold7144_cov54-Phaeocystis_antarctica.AAC.1
MRPIAPASMDASAKTDVRLWHARQSYASAHEGCAAATRSGAERGASVVGLKVARPSRIENALPSTSSSLSSS